MSNELKVFENEEFGKVRTIEIDGEPWFSAKDVAEVLGYSNPRDAVARHVDEEDKGVVNHDTLGGVQKINIINESGLYALTFSSKLPNAKKFKHWVTSEVIPQIRKTGTYNGVVDRSKLSPELQMMYMLADSQAKIEIEQKKQAEQIAKLEERQETIKEAFEPIKENWRHEIQQKINRIQKATGRQHNLLRTEIYSTLESRAGCDLETRLNNKRNRMRRDGNTVTAINKTNYIDVIAEDVRIKEIFEKIVTEYELKYC